MCLLGSLCQQTHGIIAHTGMGSGDDINFWAVGRGCCASRAQFYCDDAQVTPAWKPSPIC
eukprot:655837-Amphidinium_carterae.1